MERAPEAIVLTGFGKKAFVSGADVNFLARIEDEAQGEATSAGSQAVLNAVEKVGKPVVCAMNGLAFGGGNELAMACTMRGANAGIMSWPIPSMSTKAAPGITAAVRSPPVEGTSASAVPCTTNVGTSSAARASSRGVPATMAQK